MSIICKVFVGLSVLCLAISTSLWLSTYFIEPSLDFQETSINIGNIPINQCLTVNLPVVNRSSKPKLVLNVAPSCYLNYCIRSKQKGHLVVPAHTKGFYELEIEVKLLGRFDVEVILYVDDRGLREIPIKITGVGIDP